LASKMSIFKDHVKLACVGVYLAAVGVNLTCAGPLAGVCSVHVEFSARNIWLKTLTLLDVWTISSSPNVWERVVS
jgi:hypothetical protein